MRIFSHCLKKLCLLLCMPLLLGTVSCDSSSSQEAMLKEQVAMLQNQVKGWQEHYVRLLCLYDAIVSLESLDQALEAGLSLAAYQQKIVAVDLVVESINCAGLDIQPLNEIMACHHLAARIWEARNKGRAGDLALEYIRQVYPLWRSFGYPIPAEMSKELKQALDDYELAAEPQARSYLERVKNALDTPSMLAFLAGIGNQLLWHEAHNKLAAYKDVVTTPPYPLQ